MFAAVLTGFVALIHISFMVLEMFLWQSPIGLTIFKMSPDAAKNSALLAKNQGLYNGFLAAGLIWSYYISDPYYAFIIRIFFLSCIIIAGIFGGITAKFTILFVQALPALLALIAVLLNV